VYEARGLAGARALVVEIGAEGMARPEALDERDPKGLLQERAQARAMGTPSYRVVETRVVPPDTIFVVEAVVAERALARGEGRSKRLAEKAAAVAALDALDAVTESPTAPEKSSPE
jgi:ribonuclease-3